MRVRVHHNGDDVFIAWKPEGVIPGCRGFALLRQRNGDAVEAVDDPQLIDLLAGLGGRTSCWPTAVSTRSARTRTPRRRRPWTA